MSDTSTQYQVPGSQHQVPSALVTGGAGFIGSHLCERLVEEGHQVICLDNFNDFYDPQIKKRNIFGLLDNSNFTLIPGDILNKDLLDAIFTGDFEKVRSLSLDYEELPIDFPKSQILNLKSQPQDPRSQIPDPKVVAHLAALAGVRPSLVSPTKYVDTDVKGTLNLLEMAKEHEVDKFIFGSSSSVYGINDQVPFSEDHVTDLQISPYAAAKKSAEQFCKTYNHLYDIPIAALRFFTVYGPRQRPEMAIHKFARLMSQGEPLPMYGDGTSERDYTYVDDIVDGIMAALEEDYNFEIFNLGNSETIQLKDLIHLIGEKMGIEPKIDQQPEQLGDVHITYADVSKANELLDYQPEVSIEEGVDWFVGWFVNKKKDH
ncbi:GDP-mannose 4,6-dehydratase [Candidatus Bipolaricaulota bacterium]|nr:GDP-mannose 4,6-dehydratase [Candidatus Bipolaricaulota bacterium]